MEEEFSQLLEEEAASASQGKQKNWQGEYILRYRRHKYNFIWWKFSKVQLYVTHCYNQTY